MNSDTDNKESCMAKVEAPEDETEVVITMKRSDVKRLIELIEKLQAKV